MKNLAIWLVENLKKEHIQSHRNWLGRWIPNPGVPGSKSLGDSKVNSAFYPSEVDQMVPGLIGDSVVKRKLCPCSGSADLRQLNPIHKKGP